MFLDESGFLLIPNVRKTWAPVGQTPRLRHRYRLDRVSVISARTAAPRRHRFGLYFELHLRNITGAEVITFLRYLLRHLRGSVVLLWDGGKSHRHRDVQAFLQQYPCVKVHRFPGYAPELNPDEFVWTQAKRDLANTDHDGLVPLTLHVVRSLQRIGRSQALLRSCLTLPICRGCSRLGEVWFSATAKAVEALVSRTIQLRSACSITSPAL